MKRYQVTKVTDPYNAGITITHHYFNTKEEASQFIKDHFPWDISGDIGNDTAGYIDEEDDTRYCFKLEELYFDPQEKIEVNSPAGMIRAYKCTDPENPGVVIMLQPDGFDYEIDVAMAETHGADPCYHTKDLHVYNWNNVHSEDWTHHEVLAHADIANALST